MNRYTKAFSLARAQKRIAFVPFGVAGDPDLATSEKVFKAYMAGGADVLEIGYPFSDPMADGPVNQRAAQRAIESGITPASFFSMIKRLRAGTDIPFGLLLYANTIHHVGYDKFCRRAAQAGIDSILVADMPPEESGGLLPALKKHNLQSVFIVSELTPASRIRFICKNTTGFVYVVSRLGTTGVQADFSSTVRQTIARLNKMTPLPICVGFGISSPKHVAAVRNAGADGAIVGSALVKLVEQNYIRPRIMLEIIQKTVASLCAATRNKKSRRAK